MDQFGAPRLFFFSSENINERLTRANLSEQIGPTPCPISAPVITANEALINGSPDCERQALITFFRANRSQEEGLPISRKIRNNALLGKIDIDITQNNRLTLSHNFDYSRNTNQTFDVATYGNSANGIEGPSKINAFNANLFTTITPTEVNEFHFTYAREERPRSAVESNVPADTAMGFVTTFRFGHPFSSDPNVDETFWRTQIKEILSIGVRCHTINLVGGGCTVATRKSIRGFSRVDIF